MYMNTINTDKIEKYTYKDSNRNWWYLTIAFSHNEESTTEKDFYEGVWQYNLIREDKKIKHIGTIHMQYDEVPCVDDVMLDVLNQMNSIAIGFTKHPGIPKRGN